MCECTIFNRVWYSGCGHDEPASGAPRTIMVDCKTLFCRHSSRHAVNICNGPPECFVVCRQNVIVTHKEEPLPISGMCSRCLRRLTALTSQEWQKRNRSS